MLSILLSGLIACQLIKGQPVDSQSQPLQNSPCFGDQKTIQQKPSFTFKAEWKPTYAEPNPKPTTTEYYGPAYSDVAHLLGNISTTTWGSWDPSATERPTDTNDPYGQWAWTNLWEDANIKNFTNSALYSTTVEPTPIPTESLVLPPSDAFSFQSNLSFPTDFVFGVAGSAAQIEGAMAEEGRSPSIMEKYIVDDRPKDYLTNENYYLYKQDIARLAAMGVKHYSFSIPWTRILPFALPGTPVNQQGIDHYDDLINTCLEYAIVPIVTLTHFDSPLIFTNEPIVGNYPLSKDGGYKNETFVDAFVNYGKIVMTHFSDRVPIWIGFNQPYGYSGYPLGVKHVTQATAQLYKFYHNELKATGQFGNKLNLSFGIPASDNKEDIDAAKRLVDFKIGAFANPLYLGKDYPETWKSTFVNETEYLFTAGELEEVAHCSDFFGIDPYTSVVASAPEGGILECQYNSSHELWPICVNQTSVRPDGWAVGYKSQSYVYITPDQLREALNYFWDTYHSPILVAEFGFPEWRESEKELVDQVFDINRSIYYRSFMEAMLRAIHYDKVKFLGALAWSFADNWEFGDFKQQFGLQVVNRTTQERLYKKSFFDIMQYVNVRSEKF